MRRLCAEAEIPTIEVGPDADVVVRSAGDRAITFILNHRDEPLELVLPALTGVDLISDTAVESVATVPAGGTMAVLTQRRAS
jgi:beta-galactosidase